MALQAALSIAGSGQVVLYVSGEESAAQIRMRAERLGPLPDTLLLLATTELEGVLQEAEQINPALMIIDSIQTLYLPEIASTPVA